MPKSTAGLYGSLGAASAGYGTASRNIGANEPEIERIKTEIESKRTRDRERLLMLGQLAKLGSAVESNIERRKLVSSGAERAGIDMPEEGIFQKIKGTLFGPDLDEAYGKEQIPGKYLLGLGRAFEDDPLLGSRYKEFIDEWRSTRDEEIELAQYGPPFLD